MKNLKLLGASCVAAAMLLSATPALAEGNGSDNGLHLGTFVSAFVHQFKMNADVQVNGQKDNDGNGSFRNDYKFATSSATTTPFSRKSLGNDVEIGVVGGTSGSVITLDPAINLSGTSTAATSVVTNASTTYKGGATSTASLTSGEKVIVVGTTSTSTPGTITASIVVLLKNAWHFCTHLL